MKGVLGVAFVISVGICIGVGCAKSEEDDPLLGFGVDKTEPADAGDEGGNKKKVIVTDDDDDTAQGDDDDDDDDSTSSSSSSSSSSSGSTSSSSSSSSSGGSSSSSSSSGSTAPDPCKVLKCNTAKSLASISGDKAGAVRTITGAATQWFTVDLTEDVTGLFSSATPLKLKATLTSPPGKNFDLVLYVPPGPGLKECNVNDESSEEGPGVEDKVSIGWDDELGISDSRTITIEVREVVDPAAPAGTCDPTAKWTLKLEGNKQ